MPKNINILPKWRNFAKSGHTDYVYLFIGSLGIEAIAIGVGLLVRGEALLRLVRRVANLARERSLVFVNVRDVNLKSTIYGQTSKHFTSVNYNPRVII